MIVARVSWDLNSIDEMNYFKLKQNIQGNTTFFINFFIIEDRYLRNGQYSPDVNRGSSHRRCSIKKVILKIYQHSQESICVGVSFFIKLQDSWFLTDHLQPTDSEYYFCAKKKSPYGKGNKLCVRKILWIIAAIQTINSFHDKEL